MKKCLRVTLSLVLSMVLFVGCTQSASQSPDEPGVATLYPEISESDNALSLYNAGTYTAEVLAHNGEMRVSVTFSADRIEDIVIDEHIETSGIGDTALRILSDAILERQTSAVDVVSGATITSNALIAAVEDCAEQAGGDLNLLRTATSESATARIDVKRETQILIVGAGVSGLSAALTAADAGAEVLLIEKMPMTGGTAALAGGGFVMVDSSLNAESAVDDSLERTLNYWRDRKSVV